MQITFARFRTALPRSLEEVYLAMITPGMRAAALRFKRWQDRQATLFGKLLLLRMLQAKYPDNWRQKFQSVGLGPFGKPFIEGGPEFNISHSGEMVVLAMTEKGAVGIDVERIRPVNAKDFSQYLPEVSNLDCRDDKEHLKLFYDCWTRKEAVLKGSGAGLSVPLEQVVLSGEMAHLQGVQWFLKSFPIAADYCCNVATAQPLEHVFVESVNLHDGDSLHFAPIRNVPSYSAVAAAR
jgi:4'-phosphopantetheinyl transferase